MASRNLGHLDATPGLVLNQCRQTTLLGMFDGMREQGVGGAGQDAGVACTSCCATSAQRKGVEQWTLQTITH